MTVPVVIVVLFLSVCTDSAKPPPCDSYIYCQGPLLHIVQLNEIYPDDKTFVDQPLKFSPAEVLQNFSYFMLHHESKPTKLEIQQFVDSNFYENGDEFELWTPADWHANPKFLAEIKDLKLRQWAYTLNGLWKDLGRVIKQDVKLRPDRYSLMYVSHPFIVPGGRFREYYYWDSYWIQRGLLQSQMYETVRGMIQNFLELVESMGFVPNGGRIYYQRSQPPFLIPMMMNYFETTKDIDFLHSSIATLEKEFMFWMDHRMVTLFHKGRKYTIARYASDRTGPRPESYSSDYKLAKSFISEKRKNDLYTNIQSAAESGWDFSSRWFIPKDLDSQGNKSSTATSSILPVDLNSILFMNARTLSQFFRLIGNYPKAAFYEIVQNKFYRTIQNIFWDEELGSYFDYDFVNLRLVKEFYASSFVPLWVGVDTSSHTVTRMLNYASSLRIFDFPGGIPTSISATGEQWDFPNAWPPLQHIAIEALVGTNDPKAIEFGNNLAKKWILSNFRTFYNSIPNTMFEKYDATKFGSPGSGGEYTVVAGFGWTNGVILDLLAKYGNIVTTEDT